MWNPWDGSKTQGTKTNYPRDVSDEEWEFCAPYLTLMRDGYAAACLLGASPL